MLIPSLFLSLSLSLSLLLSRVGAPLCLWAGSAKCSIQANPQSPSPGVDFLMTVIPGTRACHLDRFHRSAVARMFPSTPGFMLNLFTTKTLPKFLLFRQPVFLLLIIVSFTSGFVHWKMVSVSRGPVTRVTRNPLSI